MPSQALSEKNKTNSKKNVHRHHMGSGGYAKAVETWDLTQEIQSSSSSTPSVRLEDDQRSFYWLLSQSVEKDGKRIIPNPKTQEVVDRVVSPSTGPVIFQMHILIIICILQLLRNNIQGIKLQDAKLGLFTPYRQHDVLESAIGIPEHGERLRGHSSFATSRLVYGEQPKKSLHADCVSRGQVCLL